MISIKCVYPNWDDVDQWSNFLFANYILIRKVIPRIEKNSSLVMKKKGSFSSLFLYQFVYSNNKSITAPKISNFQLYWNFKVEDSYSAKTEKLP